jgi:CheY-specific phosphatase CheX
MFEVNAHQHELNHIVNDVLDVMFAVKAGPIGEQQPGTDGYTACVSFLGNWTGAVLVHCEASTAERLTQRLIGTETVSPEDVIDAMGELANMIGGNMKSVLSPGVTLSTPNVALGKALSVSVGGLNESKFTLFSCEAGNFGVTLVHVPGPSLST